MKKKLIIFFRVICPTILISGFIFLLGINFESALWTRCLASSIGGLVIGVVAIAVEFHGTRLTFKPGVGLSIGIIFSLIFCLENSGLIFSLLFFLIFSLIFELKYLREKIIDLIHRLEYWREEIHEDLM
jgi:hypothetical protein